MRISARCRRLFSPPDVPSSELLVFGIVGLVGNVVAIAVLASGRRANLNLRAAFLEVVNDALGSVGVILAAVVINAVWVGLVLAMAFGTAAAVVRAVQLRARQRTSGK